MWALAPFFLRLYSCVLYPVLVLGIPESARLQALIEIPPVDLSYT